MDSRIRAALPYVALLMIAGGLYWYAGQISYAARAGVLGPDFWPKLIIAVMATLCVYQIARRLIWGNEPEPLAITDDLAAGEVGNDDDAPRFPLLLARGALLTVAYAALISTLGFIVSTFFFLAAFMYIGRVRSHAVIWITSAAGTFLLAIVFLRIVYVSMPRGMPPFDRVADLFLRLF